MADRAEPDRAETIEKLECETTHRGGGTPQGDGPGVMRDVFNNSNVDTTFSDRLSEDKDCSVATFREYDSLPSKINTTDGNKDLVQTPSEVSQHKEAEIIIDVSLENKKSLEENSVQNSEHESKVPFSSFSANTNTREDYYSKVLVIDEDKELSLTVVSNETLTSAENNLKNSENYPLHEEDLANIDSFEITSGDTDLQHHEILNNVIGWKDSSLVNEEDCDVEVDKEREINEDNESRDNDGDVSKENDENSVYELADISKILDSILCDDKLNEGDENKKTASDHGHNSFLSHANEFKTNDDVNKNDASSRQKGSVKNSFSDLSNVDIPQSKHFIDIDTRSTESFQDCELDGESKHSVHFERTNDIETSSIHNITTGPNFSTLNQTAGPDPSEETRTERSGEVLTLDPEFSSQHEKANKSILVTRSNVKSVRFINSSSSLDSSQSGGSLTVVHYSTNPGNLETGDTENKSIDNTNHDTDYDTDHETDHDTDHKTDHDIDYVNEGFKDQKLKTVFSTAEISNFVDKLTEDTFTQFFEDTTATNLARKLDDDHVSDHCEQEVEYHSDLTHVASDKVSESPLEKSISHGNIQQNVLHSDNEHCANEELKQINNTEDANGQKKKLTFALKGTNNNVKIEKEIRSNEIEKDETNFKFSEHLNSDRHQTINSFISSLEKSPINTQEDHVLILQEVPSSERQQLTPVSNRTVSSAGISPGKSSSLYSLDFETDDSQIESSRSHSHQQGIVKPRLVRSSSDVSSDDRAISSRPRFAAYNSDQDTSEDEITDLDFAEMNKAPPTTAINESHIRVQRPRSSHPSNMEQKKFEGNLVYKREIINREVLKSGEENIQAEISEDNADNYDDTFNETYSDDLESVSLHSGSDVSYSPASNTDRFHSRNSSTSSAGHTLVTSSDQRSADKVEDKWNEDIKSEDRYAVRKDIDTDGADSDHSQNKVTESKKQEMVKNNMSLERITNAAENLTHMQNSLQEMFRQAKSVLTDFQTQLKTRPMDQVVDKVPDFSRTLTSLSGAYRACESVTGGINEQLQDIRVITHEICDLLVSSAKTEDLRSPSVQSSHEDEMTEEKEARSKDRAAKILERKALSARATADAMAAHELAVQTQTEAKAAEVTAAKARDEAVLALQRAETARKMALEKKKREEEEKKRREKEMKEEEDRKRKEEEGKRKLAELRATSKKKMEDEEKKKCDALTRDTSSWPRLIYSVDHSDFDTGVGVVIKAPEGCLEHDDIMVTLVDQLTIHLPLGESEELISNVLRIAPSDNKMEGSNMLHMAEPILIAIPHCAPRIHPGREPVVKLLSENGQVVTLVTSDIQFDDIRDIRFVECRTKTFGTFAVFLRLKKDTLTFNRKGGKVISSADSRVTLACQSGTFPANVNFTLEVQQIDTNMLTSLKMKQPEECGKLLSVSPIISMNLPVKYITPLTLTLPVPPSSSSRQKRPQTAVNRLPEDKVNALDVRLASARSVHVNKEDDVVPEELHLLMKENNGLWMRLDDVTLIQLKKKDIVSFDMARVFSKLAIIRTKPEVTSVQAEKMFSYLVTALAFKQMTVIVRQKNVDPTWVTVTCSQPFQLDRTLKALMDEGYTNGPRPSPEIIVTEGQRLSLRFRGNVSPVDTDVRTLFSFNTYIPFRLRFRVSEQDKFAQKGFDSYRGFCQIFTTSKVKRFLDLSDEKDQRSPNGQRFKDNLVDGDVLLCEQLIIIPKPEPETPRPLTVAPVKLSDEGVVNTDLLRFLSDNLEDSDWKKLAQLLNVRPCRIQAILRQNISKDITQSIYDMLVTWSKRLPRSMDRRDILCKALTCIHRPDLAEEILSRDEELRQIKAKQYRDSYLDKAFVTIVRNQQAVIRWKDLARFLGISEMDIKDIESRHDSIQNCCMSSLGQWRERCGDKANISLLVTLLRQCRLRQLAKEVDKIYQLKL